MLKKILLFIPIVSFLFYVLPCYHATPSSKPVSKALAVGIALYADHATVSARYSYNYFWDVGRLEGDDDYKKLMRRLSSPATKHLSPPYYSWKDMILDQPRQTLRETRKKLGLPASSDVGTLVQMLQPIVDHAPFDIASCVYMISYPALPGLEPEDIEDAMYHVGLTTSHQFGFPPHEIVAAYAGYKMGICKNYENATKCNEEMKDLPYRDTLLVEYTETAMFLHAREMRAAVDFGHVGLSKQTTSFSLGSKAEATAEDIWSFVLSFISTAFASDVPRDIPDEMTVLMVGSEESIADGRALIGIKGAFESYGSKAKIYYSNSDYMAARGATEMAWRTLFQQERISLLNDRQMENMLDI